MSNYSNSDRDKKNSLFKASAEGVKFLVLLQISSRLLTFIANQILLRYLSPEILGLSVQYELFVISVLYFSRESIRTALQRQGVLSGSAGYGVDSSKADAKAQQSAGGGELGEDTVVAQSQTVVNLSYLTFLLGFVFVGLFYRSISSLALAQPYSGLSTSSYIAAVLLELLSEPAFAVVQQRLLYKVRAGTESAAALVRCILTCAFTAIYHVKTNGRGAGSLPFAIGQLGYAMVLFLVYNFKVNRIAKETGFSLGILGLASSSYYLSYFHKPLLRLAFSMWIQSAVKHVLTQGDSLLIAWLASSYDQGIYALASNYGSLVARMLFQPLEEASRNFFGKILSQSMSEGSSPKQDRGAQEVGLDSANVPTLKAAANILRSILRIYLILSIFAISLGPPLAPLLLRIVAGSRWANSDAGEVLSTYCYYIPLLAINGITEAFVQSVASSKELQKQSIWMFGFSVGLGVAGYALLRVFKLGAHGLVWANVVNMTLRIIWSRTFIKKYFQRNGQGMPWQDIAPDYLLVIAGVAVGAAARNIAYELSVKTFLSFGILGAGLAGICVFREWSFFLECYRLIKSDETLKHDNNRKTT